MLTKEKMNRINELARISKKRALSGEEKKEQDLLRKEYLESFRKSFRKQLDNIKITD